MVTFLKLILGVFWLACCSLSANAWNANGHRLIADIAMQQLTPRQMALLQAYNATYHFGYQPRTLLNAAVWMDWLHCRDPVCRALKQAHYIDYPYVIQGAMGHPPNHINAVAALEHAYAVLKDKHAAPAEKGLQLRILMHVLGDIHQPMHAISLYSVRFPHGDRGGNDYHLGHNRVANNLHAYWDRGGGYLTRKSLHHGKGLQMTTERVSQGKICKAEAFDPKAWSLESYQIAKTDAYPTQYHQPPSHQYQRSVVRITKERLALAGCRLGHVLAEISQ